MMMMMSMNAVRRFLRCIQTINLLQERHITRLLGSLDQLTVSQWMLLPDMRLLICTGLVTTNHRC